MLTNNFENIAEFLKLTTSISEQYFELFALQWVHDAVHFFDAVCLASVVIRSTWFFLLFHPSISLSRFLLYFFIFHPWLFREDGLKHDLNLFAWPIARAKQMVSNGLLHFQVFLSLANVNEWNASRVRLWTTEFQWTTFPRSSSILI